MNEPVAHFVLGFQSPALYMYIIVIIIIIIMFA